jgi:ABC-2 type transport system permease protein
MSLSTAFGHISVVFEKAARQQLRDRAGLFLTLATAPFFVLFYWVVFSGGDAAPRVALQCAHEVDAATCQAVEDILTDAKTTDGEDETRALDVITVSDEPGARVVSERTRSKLRRGDIDLLVFISEEYEATPARVKVVGDASSASYRVAMSHARRALGEDVMGSRGVAPAVLFEQETLGRSGARTRFEAYVPSLLVFAVIMLVFSSSMAVAREVEGRTFERLLLTGMRPVHYLAGVSVMQALLGAATVSLTLGVALALGFEARGSLALAMSVASLAGVACVGVGMIAASLSRTVAQAFLVASSFMFLLMLFSGLLFPLPRIGILRAFARDLGPFDLLPTVHASRAMGRVLTLGAGVEEILFELVAMAALGAAFFLVGWRMFKARHGVSGRLT